LPEQQIRMLKMQQEEQNEELKKAGKEMDIIYDDSWKGSYHVFGRKSAMIYDTLQDVEKYEPKGYLHKEFKCLDTGCTFKHVNHELI